MIGLSGRKARSLFRETVKVGEVSRCRGSEGRLPQARQLAGLLCLLCFGAGCAERAGAGVSTLPTPRDAEVAQLKAQLAERDRSVRQLEGRLAMLEASQRELRYALAEKAPPPPRETVRIGERAAEKTRGSAVQASPEERPAREGRDAARPVLRLYQDRPAQRSSATALGGAPSAAWMPVPSADERLPVAPVPSLASVAQRRDEPTPIPVPAPVQTLDAGAQYRRAIDLVRRREFPEALQVLNAFLLQYPDDARVPRVTFWQGEVLFAQREYTRALDAYERSLAREPRGEKAADTLLKIGFCHRQLGDSVRAQRALERLRTEFPDSAAAHMLAREDA